MATVKSFEELEVWKKARELCKELHELTYSGEFQRDFALRDQINRSAGSIMDNIAEGFERNGSREFIQFLTYAKGSAGETRSQLHRALDNKYLTSERFDDPQRKVTTISRMISSLLNYPKASDLRGARFSEPEVSYGLSIDNKMFGQTEN